MIMLLTFCAASFTHIGAEGANLLHKRAVCLHRLYSQLTHVGAFSVQPDTAA
ncbi:hypothetical protein D068_cds10680 [Bacillus atrophaeus UCMB-5137]|nr:hypothetical protein D068_cds10680 [Bacillus atrophaeus UCMB-5137]